MKLSEPKLRLLRRARNVWQWVPPATRSTTIIALVKSGHLEHRRDPGGTATDWMTWGQIRLTSKAYE